MKKIIYYFSGTGNSLYTTNTIAETIGGAEIIPVRCNAKDVSAKDADVIGFVNKYEVPVVKSPCPADGYTKREYVKDLLRNLNLENPGVKERMFTAIKSGNLKGWNLDGE